MAEISPLNTQQEQFLGISNMSFIRLTSIKHEQRGVVLTTILIVGILLTFIGLSLADLVIAQHSRTSINVFHANATLTAEAGIEYTLEELNADNTFTGYASETEFYNDEGRGRATYRTSVSTGTGNERIITSTGHVYRYGQPNNLVSERSVRVSLVGTTSVTPSVYAGAGGLILGGSASINNSDVFVNGKVTLTGAASIGTDTNPVNLNVANRACPTGSNPGATYPALCTSTPPISIPDWSTVKIIGTTCATGQTQAKFPESQWNTNAPQIRAGTSGGDGLVAGCEAAPAPLPSYDKAAHISRVAVTGSPSNTAYDCSTWATGVGFTRTWPENLQLNGNVNLTSSCDLTITGDVYITGNLTIGGAAKIKIADSLGDHWPVIVVNGTVNAAGSGEIIANSSGTAARIISYISYNNCDPNCTGTNLKRSQEIRGITVNGGGSYPGSIFHAYWSEVKIEGSGLVGSAIGQIINMEGAGNITFGTSLSSGTTTWTIRSYQRTYE